MNIKTYINRVVNTKRNVFCKIEMDDSLCEKDLIALCNLKIGRKRLIIAWSLIIDVFNERLGENVNELMTPKILNFLIDNNICICDLGHLKLKNEYLKRIYEKDNNCREALLNMKKEAIGTLDNGIRKPKYFYVVLICGFLFGFLVCFIPLVVISIKENKFDNDFIVLLIASVIFLFMTCAVLICLYKENLFFKKQIPIYMNDESAIKITAIPFSLSESGFGAYKVIRIGVKFLYDGKEETILGKKFDKQFRSIVNKETDMIFSPKYNQVVILKSFS